MAIPIGPHGMRILIHIMKFNIITSYGKKATQKDDKLNINIEFIAIICKTILNELHSKNIGLLLLTSFKLGLLRI